MTSLIDDIKAEAKGLVNVDTETNEKLSADRILIEQTLVKLFYEKPRIEEESEFIRLVLSKNGYNTERAGLHASAIIKSEKEFCYREQVLSLLYKQLQGENVPIKLKRIYEAGNSIHEKWQRLFLRGKLCRPKHLDHSRFNEKYEVSFTPDALVKIRGVIYIVEIKSVNTFQFQKMKSHPSAKKQLMLYMFLTGIHNGFVLCEDKNTQDAKVFLYEYNKEIAAPFIERLEAIQEYKSIFLEDRKMAKRICSKSSCKRALDCNMREACYNIGKGRIKL